MKKPRYRWNGRIWRLQSFLTMYSIYPRYLK